jgi:hypothetical protein
MPQRIVKQDQARQAEITMCLNDDMDVIGVEIRLFQPISLVDFSFEKLFANNQAWLQARMAASMFNAAGRPGVNPPPIDPPTGDV